MRIGFAVSTLAVLAGCAIAPPSSQDDIAEANTPLYCIGLEQCTLYWRRAQVWVSTNSGMKVQLASDAIIETYSSRGPTWAYRVLRIPEASGRERITLATQCGNIFGCGDSSDVKTAQFKRFVKGGS